MVSEKTCEVLKKAGWYPGRKIDIGYIVDVLEKEGYVVFQKASKFVRFKYFIRCYFHAEVDISDLDNETKNFKKFERKETKMRKGIIFIFLLSIMLIVVGCNSTVKKSSNSLKITKEDEKIITEYLDAKTNDITSPSGGEMYSAFSILGTDSDKIYVWMLLDS